MIIAHTTTVATNAAKTALMIASSSPSPNRLGGSPIHGTRHKPNDRGLSPSKRECFFLFCMMGSRAERIRFGVLLALLVFLLVAHQQEVLPHHALARARLCQCTRLDLEGVLQNVRSLLEIKYFSFTIRYTCSLSTLIYLLGGLRPGKEHVNQSARIDKPPRRYWGRPKALVLR